MQEGQGVMEAWRANVTTCKVLETCDLLEIGLRSRLIYLIARGVRWWGILFWNGLGIGGRFVVIQDDNWVMVNITSNQTISKSVTYLNNCTSYSIYGSIQSWQKGTITRLVIGWGLWPTSEIFAVPPRAPEVAVRSPHRNRGYSLFLLLVLPQPRSVHSRW